MRHLIGFLLLLLTVTANASQYFSYTDVGVGTPIVFIHAFPTDQRLWQPQHLELKRYFRVITLDMRGFGYAVPANGDAIKMDDYADDVKQLLSQLHIKKAVIAGESMGGYIALAFLQKYPESISKLVLSDTQAIADTVEIKEKREAAARDVLKNGTQNFINTFITKALSPTASPDTQNYLRAIVNEQSAKAIASALRGMALRSDLTDSLATTNIPILIITGEDDALISPQQSKNMHSLAKHSKLIIIKHAGHLPSLEQPIQWNKAVKEWASS